MLLIRIGILIAMCLSAVDAVAQVDKPLRVGVAGLTHTHVHWLLGRKGKSDFQIVGISEPNSELAGRYVDQYDLEPGIVYSSLNEMIEKTEPDAICAFGTIFEHLEVVETCAPLGLHVMVEKPLAVSLEHAKRMQALAKKHEIYLLTNYETTWYGSNHETFDILNRRKELGPARKIVVHDGHHGPKEIGINKEFLEWLTDPEQNGGGAITDFGCYGANLATWLMNNERPISVTAVTQTIKPELYANVDDEATIILAYPKAQAILQASWNWPFNRKDLHVYGQHGYAKTIDGSRMRVRLRGWESEKGRKAEQLSSPNDDPFSYFAAVVNGEIKPKGDLSSLENNMIVMEILDAAVRSAKEGKTITLQNRKSASER